MAAPTTVSAAVLVGQACLQLRRLAASEPDACRYRQLLEAAADLQGLIPRTEKLEAGR